jgi:AGCS family alanine or glycine:cation symporter
MALFYIFGSLCVIGANIERLPEVLCSIISGAFSNRAIIGGAGAYTAKEALSAGFKRGMLSNEAGLGSAPMAHGSADCESPVLQGFYGIFEVFFDTIVICTLTAVTVLISGVPISYGTLGGAEYCTWALSSVFGDRLSALFMCVTITLFAFSSIISWSLYGERCVEFLIGKNAAGTYRLAFSAVTLLSSVMSFSLIVRLSDVMNALMAIPNLVALLLLMPAVRDETRRYFSAKK